MMVGLGLPGLATTLAAFSALSTFFAGGGATGISSSEGTATGLTSFAFSWFQAHHDYFGLALIFSLKVFRVILSSLSLVFFKV
jgi:hypothetical protein